MFVLYEFLISANGSKFKAFSVNHLKGKLIPCDLSKGEYLIQGQDYFSDYIHQLTF